jgi:hypothetical protein
MNLETDLHRIDQLSEKNNGENWDFRRFLKDSPMAGEAIDAIVHKLNEDISWQIDCTQCANCCKVLQIQLREADIERLAQRFKISREEFRSRWLKEAEEEGMAETKSLPCPFLKDKRCSVYEDRPAMCRSFPNLHKPHFTSRTIQVVFNCFTCPIVFNVYEELKDYMGYRRRR